MSISDDGPVEHHYPVGPAPDPDYELVDRLFTLHPPANDLVALTMDGLRGHFRDLASEVVAVVPRTPDRTVALRSIHRACMDSIAALACNQDNVGPDDGT
jgi:hypothetical protein